MNRLGMTELVAIAWLSSLSVVFFTEDSTGILEVLKILVSGYLGYMVRENNNVN